MIKNVIIKIIKNIYLYEVAKYKRKMNDTI